jgi:hypothetical protein
VKLGLVASLNRPGGNVTGVNLFVSQMEGKRLGLLRELVPSAALIAVLLNPNNPNAATQLEDVQEAARALGQQIHILHAGSEKLAAFHATVCARTPSGCWHQARAAYPQRRSSNASSLPGQNAARGDSRSTPDLLPP